MYLYLMQSDKFAQMGVGGVGVGNIPLVNT